MCIIICMKYLKCTKTYQHHKHQCSSSDAEIHNIFLLDKPCTEFLHKYLPRRYKCLLGMLSNPALYLAGSNTLLDMAAHSEMHCRVVRVSSNNPRGMDHNLRNPFHLHTFPVHIPTNTKFILNTIQLPVTSELNVQKLTHCFLTLYISLPLGQCNPRGHKYSTGFGTLCPPGQ